MPGERSTPGAGWDGGPLGLVLPTFPQDTDTMPSATKLAAVCRGAEEAGAGALWACDHLFWHRPHLECMTTLGLAVAATERVTVGSCVVQLPLRDPLSIAKEAASLWHVSGGRFVLGVGVGGRRAEYEAAGVPFTTRGKALDEGIGTLRATWQADAEPEPEPEPEPAPASAPGPASAPAPGRWRQRPPAPDVPVWVGGSSEAALRRAARTGDGWIPLFVPPEDYGTARTKLEEEVERAGRPPGSVVPAMTVFCLPAPENVPERSLEWIAKLYDVPQKAFARHVVRGTPRACAAHLARYVEAGARHICVFVAADDPLVPFEDLVGSFARLDAGPSGPAAPGRIGTGGTAVEERT